MRIIFTLTLICLNGLFVFGQTFQDVASDLGVEHAFIDDFYGGGCSLHDFNRDGLADISLTSGAGQSKFYINNGDSFEEIYLGEFSGLIMNFVWVDFDNDGDSDLSYTVFGGQFHLLENLGDLELVEVDLDLNNNVIANNYGISWADYDRDGYLDFYVARYNGWLIEDEEHTNRLIKNNGDGTFTDVTDITGLTNDLSATFSSSWFDYDNDGDLDLYVINDRAIFINRLYQNNGDNTFTDVTILTNADVAIDAMTNTVGDYNNDGFIDVYLSNGFNGNHLLTNMNGEFIDEFPNSGLEVYQDCWGANWIDFDHNGYKDIYVCSSETQNRNAFFINDEGIDFDRDDSYFPIIAPKRSYSCAKGDINSDGLYDLLVLNSFPDTSSVFLNEYDNEYNYVEVALQGTYSNKDAVGTRLDYYINGNAYTEITHAGTDYLSQDSQYKLLSIPSPSQSIDSILISWPRGLKETHYNINSGSQVTFIEGESFEYSTLNYPANSICAGEATSIEISAEADSIVWSNGTYSSELSISEPGSYTATVFFPNYALTTEEYLVLPSAFPVVDSVSITPPLCHGDINGQAIVHSSSSLDSMPFAPVTFEDLPEGTYSPTLEFPGYCEATVSFEVLEPDELLVLSNAEDADCYGQPTGIVNFNSTGGTGEVSTELELGLSPDALFAGTYTYISTDQNGCTFSDTFTIAQPDSLVTTAVVTNSSCYGQPFGAVDFSSAGGTGEVSTEVEFGLSPDSLFAGMYTFISTDENGCAYSDTFSVEQPDSIVTTAVVTNATCYEQPTGAVDFSSIGGTGEILTEIEFGFSEDSLLAGVYNFISTDQNGCVFTDTFSVEEPDPLVTSSLVTDATCYEEPTGAVEFNSVGGTGEVLTEIELGLPHDSLFPGVYEFISTDINGCTYSNIFSIGQPDSMVTIAIVTNANCNGEPSGMVEFINSGGTGTITTSISDEFTTNELLAGSYEYTSIDENGCLISGVFNINEPDLLTLSVDVTNATELELGVLELEIAGGTEPYSISLNDNDIEDVIISASPGEYCFTVTDALGCSAEQCDSVFMTVGLSEIFNNELNMYPNPSHSFVYVEGLPSSLHEVLIVNALGQELISVTNDKSLIKLDVSEFEKGIYFLRCNVNDTTIFQRKLVVD